MYIIEKDLHKSRSTSYNGAEKHAEEIKLLIDGSSIEERNILKEAGLDFNVAGVEKVLGVNMVRSKKEIELDAKVFTEDEIRTACIKYDLRFLQSRYYKGKIEPNLGKKILEFFANKNIDGKNHEAHNNLYIMAPKKAFNLEAMPNPPQLDPMMFYKMSTTEGEMYAVVHKWGKDFTPFRRILGAARETSWHWFWFRTLMVFLASTLTTALFYNPISLEALFINACVAGAVVGVWNLIEVGDESSSWSNYSESFNRNAWNSKQEFRG
jgi:hypothetical protein